MNRKMRSLLSGIFLTVVLGLGAASAQTMQTAPAAGKDLLSTLPASDVVGFLNLRRIMTEVAPRVFAKDTATLAKIMAGLDEVNKKTGVNILSIDRVVMGARFFGSSMSNLNKEDIGIVIIVHGDFDANTFIAALKRETKGKVDETTYGGKIVYSEPLPAPPKKKAPREVPAVAVIDSNTLAVGDLPQVRAAIDAAVSGNGRVDSALVELAERDESALIGVAGNIPETLRQALSNSAPKEESEKAIVNALLGLRQVYSSVGSPPIGFNIIFGGRFSTTEQAQSVGDLLLGLRQQVGSQIPDKETRDLLEGVQIIAEGNEVQLKSDIKNEVVQDFIASMVKEEKPATSAGAASSSTKAKPKTKRRRASRRRRH
ncbi:MAG TPA: hypothetical protein VM095_07295 [Pyrinomonadaceae bacterium]|nr:hypothetical protein [Pyrinomonadaceae bacterium]